MTHDYVKRYDPRLDASKKNRAPPKELWKISVMERTAELMEKKKSQASTRGLWDGPGICNEWIGGMARDAACNNVAFEHCATPCSGHAALCHECRVRNIFCSYSSIAVGQQVASKLASESSL